VELDDAELPLNVVVPPAVSNDIPSHIRIPTNQFLEPSHMMQVNLCPLLLFHRPLFHLQRSEDDDCCSLYLGYIEVVMHYSFVKTGTLCYTAVRP
jgi:hypothetical protein